MSPRRDTPQPNKKPRKLLPKHKSLPEEFAHDAVAHEKATPGDRVEMVFRVRLRKPVAEALTARASAKRRTL